MCERCVRSGLGPEAGRIGLDGRDAWCVGLEGMSGRMGWEGSAAGEEWIWAEREGVEVRRSVICWRVVRTCEVGGSLLLSASIVCFCA